MKLRWLTEANRVTADDVLAARVGGCGFALMTIKTILQDKTEPRLQYYVNDVEGWVDIPHVVEYREGPLDLSKVGLS
jgi:hypothetical protein